MTSNELFSALAEKDIICWREEKYFRNITYPFLCRSGLVENLCGFVDGPGAKKVSIGGRSFPKYNKSVLAGMNQKTVLLITVTGYLEILAQIIDSPYISYCLVLSLTSAGNDFARLCTVNYQASLNQGNIRIDLKALRAKVWLGLPRLSTA